MSSDSMDFVPILLEAAKESPVGMLIADAEGVIQYVNRPFSVLSGYTIDELTGQHVGMLDAAAADDQTHRAIQTALTGGLVWKGELQGQRKDGSVYWQDATISPVIHADGQLTHTVRIVIDITDHVRQREAFVEARRTAEEASAAKSRFLANMSHEIRTPMNVVLGLSKMLLKHHAENLTDYQRQRLTMIGDSGRRLMTLINDILDLSRVESGKVDVQADTIFLGALMLRLEAVAENFLQTRPIDFQVSRAEDVPEFVIADSRLLEQVLVNLISNAYKFTESGHIHLRIYRRDDALYFDVEDTGIGISLAQQAMIFDPFTQADSSTTRPYQGTGLGLAICQKSVVLMGGQISVSSEPGRGTTMTFWVPLCAARPPQAATAAASQTEAVKPADRSGRKARVLAVEDDEYGRVYLEMMLEETYELYFACDGKEAVQRYFEVEPDLVLMDIMMPEMDGFDAFSEIHRRSSDKPAPIIALSARAMKTEQADILSHGFADCVAKPIDDEALLAAIEKHLAAASS